jgi:predicted RecB family nuclease
MGLLTNQHTDSGLLPLPGVRLSKSKFLSGLQCPKRLYLEIHAPELATKPDEQQQAILDMGSEVGVLARRRFSNGVLVEADHRHPTAALEQTAKLVANPNVPAIFEGAFEYDRILVRVDILERLEPGVDGAPRWRLIEVKSSTRVKETHLEDLAVQTHVVKGAGLSVAGSWLLHINSQYSYQGHELDLEELFALYDLTAVVAEREPHVAGRVRGMRDVLTGTSPPQVDPDNHCHTPYSCPFWNHCIKDKPARWIYHLPGGERTYRQLTRLGIGTIDDIPQDFKLTTLQRLMKEEREWIGPRLKSRLEDVQFPVHHLDFETCMPAIPKFPLTRPYLAIPTQWSNHIELADGSVRHEEYLCDDPRDPRPMFLSTLLESLGQEGSICVYSSYERTILERLAGAYPQFAAELQRVIGRLWDLLAVVREQYYHPGFQGSFSIKSVMPALVPGLSYSDLEIQDGGVAAHAYAHMLFEETDWVERERIREALMRYCERDTFAMLQVRRILLEKVRSSGVP